METKNIVATLYLKNGKAVKSKTDFTEIEDVYQLCQMYNDSGVDKIVILDLSTDDDEHEKNINTIKNINRNIEIKVCAGGNINRIEDIKSMRTDWLCKNGLGSSELAHKPFSLLELMIIMSGTLAFLCQRLVDYSTHERWFNEMCYNAGLRFDISAEEALQISSNLVMRRYDSNGLGGFFPVQNVGFDQRNVEIWTQANEYITEKYL